jgi:hypothetical protein
MDFINSVVANRAVIMIFVLIVASIAIVAVLIFAQFKKDSFDLRFLVVDDVTHKPSIHKAGQGVALVVSTWGFVYQMVNNRFTDTYLLVYMCWAGIEAVNRMSASRLGNSPVRYDDRNDNNPRGDYDRNWRDRTPTHHHRKYREDNDYNDDDHSSADDHPSLRDSGKPLRN